MKRVLAVLTLVLAALAVAGANPAFADSQLVIRSVDTTKFPQVVISTQLNGPATNLADVHLRENGQFVNGFNAVPLGRTNTPVGIVLVVDTSGSMNQNGKLEQAKAAARQFVSSKQPNDQIALVSFNTQPRVLVNFTTDPGALLNGINGLAATGETALWDAVSQSVALFADHPSLQPNVVVLSDGADTVSKTSFDAARSAAQTAHA
ncbi:MAG: VWA domain-containing protein, partial [Actinobacteria bacterium]